MQAGDGINPAVLKRTAGYIYKKGGVVNVTAGRRNWKRRWFVIETKNYDSFVGYEFRYYETPNGKLKGSLDLTNVEVFCDERPRLGVKSRYDFHILLANGSSLQLSCEDYHEREEWMETLNMVIAYSRKMVRASANTLDGYDPLYEDEENIFTVGAEIAHNCQAFGPGLFGAEVGQHAQFVIQTHDLHGNMLALGGMPFTATLTDDECMYYLQLTDNRDGTYSAYYIISRPGIYLLSIRLNDEHDIYGSPFEVEILPSKTVPAKCTVQGESLTRVQTGGDCQFTIVARDGYGNQKKKGGDAFEVGIMGSAQLKSLEDNGDGTYLCTFEAHPPTEMNYYAASSLMIQVCLNGKHVSGSPFRPTIDDVGVDIATPIYSQQRPPAQRGVNDILSTSSGSSRMKGATKNKIQTQIASPKIFEEEDVSISEFDADLPKAPLDAMDAQSYGTESEFVTRAKSSTANVTENDENVSVTSKSNADLSESIASGIERLKEGASKSKKLQELHNRVAKAKSSGAGNKMAKVNSPDTDDVSKGAARGSSKSGDRSMTEVKRLIQDLQENRKSAGGNGLPGFLESTNSSEKTVWRITAEALQNDKVVALLVANAVPLYKVFESCAAPVDNVKAVGSVVYKLLEEYDVLPQYITRKELKLIYQVINQSQINSQSSAPPNLLDFPGLVRLLVACAVYALSKTSAYVALYPESESKVDVMLTKWGFADPSKLQLVETRLSA